MEYKEAVDVLLDLQKKDSLDDREKEAVNVAIGVLSWASLSESKLKAQKAKRAKSAEW